MAKVSILKAAAEHDLRDVLLAFEKFFFDYTEAV